MYIFTLSDNINVENFGGKAAWLKWLYENGISIPDTLFIRACNYDEVNILINQKEFIDELNDKLATINVSQGLAVRSSSLTEDGKTESKAGNFNSYLNVKGTDNILRAIVNVVKSNKNNNIDKMGVVIQSMVNADVSGVVFSSNPINASKNEIIINAISGYGEALVSGETAGDEIFITIEDGKFIIPKNDIKISTKSWIEFCDLVKAIEKKLNFPVDIEWCYIAKNDQFILVQCRPITTIFISNQILKINNDNIAHMPQKLLNSDKIRLRLFAEKNDVKMSDGFLVQCNCIDDKIPFEKVEIERTGEYRGYSVVILYPPKISQKVIRSFIGDKHNVSRVTRCHRYGVRSLPDYENLSVCLENFYQIVKKESWVCSIIIQEIYDPIYTGIIKRTNDGFILEFAKGHFVSKGVVPMTTYFLNSNGKIIFQNEIRQYSHIGIIEGCTLEYGCSDDEDSSLVTMPQNAVSRLVGEFNTILKNNSITVEFGVLKMEGEYIPYLIDCTNDEKSDNLKFEDFKSGIISEGALIGRIKKLEMENFDDALNFHFYNEITKSKILSDEKIIFYADLPSIKYLDLLSVYNSENIAFVFNKGSLLCHLSVILREKRIPAIVGVGNFDVVEGELYKIDTTAKKKIIKME